MYNFSKLHVNEMIDFMEIHSINHKPNSLDNYRFEYADTCLRVYIYHTYHGTLQLTEAVSDLIIQGNWQYDVTRLYTNSEIENMTDDQIYNLALNMSNTLVNTGINDLRRRVKRILRMSYLIKTR